MRNGLEALRVRFHPFWRHQHRHRLFSASVPGVSSVVLSKRNDHTDDAGSCRQHRGQFCNHHHMASVCRRDNDGLLQSTCARRPKLFCRRSWPRGRNRLHSRLRARKNHRLGNFWADLIRAVLWVLLPVSLVGSLFLVAQGVPMNFQPYTVARTIEGATQTIAQGPVAALELIKNLGTHGGGFFNANGEHPFENPTPLTNFMELLAIVILPAALTHTFGRMVGRPRDGWVIFWTMTALFIAGLIACNWAESTSHPSFACDIAGGNMEGKEQRFGIAGSALAAVVTSNTSTGSYNSMDDSFQPLGVAVPLVNMLLGEIIFGELGGGLYGMIFVALIGLFIGGLMIGRTPEHLGKQIGPPEMKIIAIYTLVAPVTTLALAALAVVTKAGLAGLTTNTGPHGFTEILFAYASCFANNGQTMASLSANNIFYNATTIIAMLVGRYILAVLALSLAGRFAAMTRRPPSPGTMPSDGVTFGVLLTGTALLVGALNFFPALAMGPIVEHFSMHP